MLRRLLEAGVTQARAFGGRGAKRGPRLGDDTDGVKRFRSADVFSLVAADGVQTVLDIQARASELSSKGDKSLAEFCTTVGQDKLEDLVQSALAVTQAPKTLALKNSTLMGLLRKAAQDGTCACNGVWLPGALKVLGHQGEDVKQFCQDMCRAFQVGAKRGTNMAIIGEPGCGKSMVFESLDLIFEVSGKPDSKSTFPLAGLIDADVLVWQEYSHKDSILLFEDLLAVLCGEKMGIRVPHRKNVQHRNVAPMFYSSNSMLAVRRDDPETMQRLNSAMAERFCTRKWQWPIPKQHRIVDFPRCGRCCANLFLLHR